MKNFQLVLLALFMVFVMFSCKKKEDVAPETTVICWTSSASKGGAWTDIYINGELKGRLTEYMTSQPACDAATSASTVVFKMRAGSSFTYRGVGADGTQWNGTSTATSNTSECRLLNFN